MPASAVRGSEGPAVRANDGLDPNASPAIFLQQTLRGAMQVEAGLYWVPGVNQTVDRARQRMEALEEELRHQYDPNRRHEDVYMQSATVGGELGALGAFDNSDPDHFEPQDLEFLFRFYAVRLELAAFRANPMASGRSTADESRTLPEALSGPDRDKWLASMMSEISYLGV